MEVTKETITKINKFREEYDKKCYDLILEEARKNNPYKRDDIIKDHCNIGRIKSFNIGINTSSKEYNIKYRCERLTNKLENYRSGESVTICLEKIKLPSTKE
jgi:hypothetical protein